MIISVFNKGISEPEKYSFTDELVYLGRNPPPQSSVTINSQTISRNHLKVKVAEGNIQIMDLNSSNGTFLEGEKIEPNSWKSIAPEDKVQVAEFQGYITFAVRQASISKPLLNTKNKHKTAKSESSDSQQRSRSRDNKSKSRELPFKISESTLKMLKDMTINKKSKEERVKFLKLMGIGKAEEYWTEIEELLKQKKGIKDSRKTNDDLERQFSSARNGVQKKGLGK